MSDPVRGASARGAAQLRLIAVCHSGVIALGADGAAVTMFGDGGTTLAFASDETAGDLEREQQTVGEGPTLAAFANQAPLIVPDLKGEDAQRRWPVLSGALAELPVGRFVALPLGVGGIRLGVLSLYSTLAAALSRERLTVGLLVADNAALAMLDAEEESPGSVPLSELGPVLDYRIHQATGMVMGQTGSSAHNALTRLRARAFAEGLSLERVADDVIAWRVRFDPEDG